MSRIGAVALSLLAACATEVQEATEPVVSSDTQAGSGGSETGGAATGGKAAGGMAGKPAAGSSGRASTEGGAGAGGQSLAGAGQAGGGAAGGGTGGAAGGGAGGKANGGAAGMSGNAGSAGSGGTGGSGPKPCATGKLVVKGGAASSTELATFAAPLAWDGDAVTRWASGIGEPEWLYVDLGEVAHISRVRLSWETAFATAYRVERSNATSGPWTVMQQVGNGDGTIDDLSALTAGNGRYVRMYGITRSTAYGFSLYELEVFGDLDETCD